MCVVLISLCVCSVDQSLCSADQSVCVALISLSVHSADQSFFKGSQTNRAAVSKATLKKPWRDVLECIWAFLTMYILN